MILRNAWRLGHRTVNQFLDNGGPLLGAALAFWAILSVAPLVLIVLSTIRWVLGDAATHSDLTGQLALTVEPGAADWVESLVDNLRQSEAGPGAGIIGSMLLLWSASRLFRQMQDALNQLWRIRRDASSVRENVMTTLQRFASAMAMVFILGGTLVVAIVLSSMAAAVRGALGEELPGSHLAWSLLTVGLSVFFLSVIFATVYRLLPDAKVAWRDAAFGGAVTAVVFCASEYPLSYYLGSQGIDSVFGAAGSLVTFLLWVYYCAQLFFLGAQFTCVFAEASGRFIRPQGGACLVREQLIPPEAVSHEPQDAFLVNDPPPDAKDTPNAHDTVSVGGKRPYPATARASSSSNSGSRL